MLQSKLWPPRVNERPRENRRQADVKIGPIPINTDIILIGDPPRVKTFVRDKPLAIALERFQLF